MKNSKSFDIIILLSALLILCSGMSFLSGQIATDTIKQVWQQLQPFLISRNTQNVAAVITQLSYNQQKNIVQQLLADTKSTLTAEDKIRVVFEVVLSLTKEKEREELLQMLMNSEHIINEVPPIYVARLKKYSPIAKMLLKIIPKAVQNNLFFLAIQYALRDDKKATIMIETLEFPLSVQQATQLIWQVVEERKNPALITALVKKGAQISSKKNGRTLLVLAVEQNQPEVVQVLIENKANINEFDDPSIGSPLQVAVRKGLTAIEMLLRKHGARE